MMCRSPRRLGCFCVVVALAATSVQAQDARRPPKEIGQIVDAALHAVIPPGLDLTGQAVAERGIRFDFDRTMAGFGYAGDRDARASLGMTRDVTAGTDSLLVDCDQLGSKECARLGRSVYVHVEPISVSSSQAVVWVHVSWATKWPSGRTFMAGSSTEVFLTRSGSGPWVFARTGRGLIT